MTTIRLAAPGLRQGPRAERSMPREISPSDQRLSAWLRRQFNGRKRFAHFRDDAAKIRTFWATAKNDSPEQADEAIARLRSGMRSQMRSRMQGAQHSPELLHRALALIAVEVERLFGLRLHDEQLFAGMCLLEGRFVEMATGEGKTITAALPAIIAGLTGTPVHVITANDYLVARDEGRLRPLYRRFGLSSAHVCADMDDNTRRLGYSADITYVGSRQVVFDYLRDKLAAGPGQHGLCDSLGSLAGSHAHTPLLRGLWFAIIDEADNALIDDARTPMIIARPLPGTEARATDARIALAIAATLEPSEHFSVDTAARTVMLTESGRKRAEKRAARLSGDWQVPLLRNDRIRQALTIQHVFRRDRDYILRDESIALIDESSGRILEGRKLQHGLHTVLEVHEGLVPTPETEPAAALSFQRFFPRYLHLAGMSGTLEEVSSELTEVYGPVITKTPTHHPVIRTAPTLSLFPDRKTQFSHALESVRNCITAGRPVLIGTRTVECSEAFSAALNEAGLKHHLLNARQDADEAGVIAAAGETGAITVATNMAGRGTDIVLSPESRTAGGLHVIVLEINDSARVDRQLFGRAGRQGDPGSGESILSLKDELLDKKAVPLLLGWIRASVSGPSGMPSAGTQRVARILVRHAQKQRERLHARMRQQAFRSDSLIDRRFAFAGDRE